MTSELNIWQALTLIVVMGSLYFGVLFYFSGCKKKRSVERGAAAMTSDAASKMSWWQKEIQELMLRLKPAASALVLWSRFTLDEQDRLGGDFEKAYRKYGTVGMYQKVRKGSIAEATLHAAWWINLLSTVTRDQLLRKLKEENQGRTL